MELIPYGRQNISEDDIKAVNDVLRSDYLTQGPKLLEFETKFAKYIGCKYAVAVSNGTGALHLAALALNVSERSNVITSPITFAASANCIKYCGGNVYFADIVKDTFVIDIEKVKSLIESHPHGFFSGIIPVDLAGYPVNMEELKKLASEYNLWIIEDACHAPGGNFKNSKGIIQNCGNCNYSDLAIFSFHPVKHIATGEGGMITTNNEELYKKLLLLRTHGITKDTNQLTKNDGGWYYEMQELGYNYRLTDFQAALGISQLSRATEGIKKRKSIAERYNQAFENTSIITPVIKENVDHAYHLYIIQTKKRLELYNHLKANGIVAQVHYIPVHKMPYYKRFSEVSLPVSEQYYEHCLSLPMYPTLTVQQQDYVIETILKFISVQN